MGTIYLFIVVLILTTCSLLNKNTVGKINPFTIQWVQAGLNALLLPVWYYLSRKFAPEEQLTWTTAGTALLAGFLSSVGFVLFLAGLKEKPVYVATSLLSSYPAITMIICMAMGTERVTAPKIVGVLAILAGLLLIQVFDKI